MRARRGQLAACIVLVAASVLAAASWGAHVSASWTTGAPGRRSGSELVSQPASDAAVFGTRSQRVDVAGNRVRHPDVRWLSRLALAIAALARAAAGVVALLVALAGGTTVGSGWRDRAPPRTRVLNLVTAVR